MTFLLAPPLLTLTAGYSAVTSVLLAPPDKDELGWTNLQGAARLRNRVSGISSYFTSFVLLLSKTEALGWLDQ